MPRLNETPMKPPQEELAKLSTPCAVLNLSIAFENILRTAGGYAGKLFRRHAC